MRGDPPQLARHTSAELWSTPHARGSTSLPPLKETICFVYPACAGIHLCRLLFSLKQVCLPRMRGDPPQHRRAPGHEVGSTPHARGSTS